MNFFVSFKNLMLMLESWLMDSGVIGGIIGSVIPLIGTALFYFIVVGRKFEKIDRLEKEQEKLEKRLEEACEKLSKVEGGLERDRAHDDLVKRESPISLTDKGKALLLDSGGQEYIETNKESLIEAIKNKTPQSAYDVQEFAKQVIREKSIEPNFIPIKNYLYAQGLDLDRAVTVLGIHLRDIAFPALGFKPEDIDGTPSPSQADKE